MNETNGNEKRAIIAIVLSMAVLWLWSSWIAPPPAPAPDPSTVVAPGEPATTPAAPSGAEALEAAPVVEGGEPAAGEAPVASTPALPERLLPLQTAEWQGEWSSTGGVLRGLLLSEHKGPYAIQTIYSWVVDRVTGKTSGGWKPYGGGDEAQELLSATATLGLAGGMDGGAAGAFKDGSYEVLSSTEREVAFERISPEGLRITKRYTAGSDPYQGTLLVRFENATDRPLNGRLWVGAGEHFTGKYSRFSNDARPAAVVDGDLEIDEDVADLVKKGAVVRQGPVSWFGVISRYFLTAMIPSDAGWGVLTSAPLGEEHGGIFLVQDSASLSPGEARELSLQIYAGPKAEGAFREIGHDLDKSVEWGFFGFFAKILYWLLITIHNLIGDWGLSIIALTVLVKGIFFPLTQKSFRSQQEMKAVQPLLNELKEKYKDDREMQAQEQMRLFKEHGVNPMSGCLPMAIQMPIWFALYSTLLYSVDLYRSEFLIWRDLSAQDPYAILPVIVGVLMFVQQWMTPMTGVDPAQQKLFKFMPLIFIFIMFGLPSGLCLYITLNSVLSIAQQWFIKRKYEGVPPAAGVSAAPAPTKKEEKKARKP
ncbi:MAG: membrane protein insertase YidC [Pseudomonadota bacterium]